MANEIRVRGTLGILRKSGSLTLQDYRSNPAAFNADQAVNGGPSPGQITVTTTGTDVDLSQLAQPGMCFLHNMDPTNYVEYGIWDTERSIFFYFGELLPGEFTLFRFSRKFAEEYAGAGTGTSAATNRLRFYAHSASCKVKIDAFEA